MTYTVKYRQPGQWFRRTVRRVVKDGFVTNKDGSLSSGSFRYLQTEDDRMLYFSIHAEVWFPKKRNQLVEKKVSRDAGQPIQRA